MWISYITGVGLLVPLCSISFGPYITGKWHSSQHDVEPARLRRGFKLAMVWLFLMAWNTYGVEVCASFAPEYKNTKTRHRPRAAVGGDVRSPGGGSLPARHGGLIGAPNAALAEGQFYPARSRGSSGAAGRRS